MINDNINNHLEKLEFKYPFLNGFTIYTKSGCKFCSEVKKLLSYNKCKFNIIDCDDYLLYTKDEFLFFIKTLIGIEYKTFPMVFYNNIFIGGYIETEKFIERSLLLESDF